MIALLQQAVDDFVRRVVGVGDEVKGITDGDDVQEHEHFVQQGPPVTIGPDKAFMNPCC